MRRRGFIIRLCFCIPLFLSLNIYGQEHANFREIRNLNSDLSNAYHILFLPKAMVEDHKVISKSFFTNRTGVEVLFENNDEVLQHLNTLITDGIRFGSIDSKKVYVVDMSEAAEASLALIASDTFKPSKTIIFGKYNPIIFNKLLDSVSFVPLATAQNKELIINDLGFIPPTRKWGFEVSKGLLRRRRKQDSLIQKRNTSLFNIEFQFGSWFLLSDQNLGNERYNIANTGNNYKLNFGYGLSKRLILQGGLGISFKLPNEDAQRAEVNNATPGVNFSNETRNQFIFSSSLGLKYYINQGKVKYYGLLGYERVNMELINFKVFTNNNGEIRDRFSSIDENFNTFKYGLGMETNLSARLYFNFQFEYTLSESFQEPINSVTNFNNLSFSFGLGLKLGNPKIGKR